MAEVELPPNSRQSKKKPEGTTKKQLPTVKLETAVAVQKPSIGSRVKNIFIKGHLKDAVLHITNDVLVPTLRDMLWDATTQGIERTIYGDNKGRLRSVRGVNMARPGEPTYSYQTPVRRQNPKQQVAQLPDQAPRMYTPTPAGQPQNLVFGNRNDAMQIVDNMQMVVETYRVVSIADLYEMVGLPFEFTHHKWGWYTLNEITVQQTREGWVLVLPPVEPIHQN